VHGFTVLICSVVLSVIVSTVPAETEVGSKGGVPAEVESVASVLGTVVVVAGCSAVVGNVVAVP